MTSPSPSDTIVHRHPVAALPVTARARRRVALLIEPRFPGGTSGAVAAEIRALAGHADLTVFGLDTAMFRNRPANPAVLGALSELGLPLVAQPAVVHADTIVLHNPSCLKFDARLGPRLSAARTLVVTHENFERPGGTEAFDVSHCLGLIDRQCVGGERLLAPVSVTNRANVAAWLARQPWLGWRLAADDWPNICDQPFIPPTRAPRDRRGRHSRPGFEKFPPLAQLRAQFPAQAEHCAILGADTLLPDRDRLPPHWQLLPFGGMKVPDFLATIDFFVYFTHPLWRESFGRAIAEAIAAGKLVITDPATAEPFGAGVIAAGADDVDRIVAAHIAEPESYGAAVRRAQIGLAAHRPDAVIERIKPLLVPEADNAVL